MSQQNKFQILSSLGLALLALLVVAAGLPNLHLQPGHPFSLGGPPPPITVGGEQFYGGGDYLLLFFRGMMALAILLVPLYILIHIFNPEGRQRLIADAIVLGILFLLADYASHHPNNLLAPNASPAPSQGPIPLPSFGPPTTTFVAQTPTWMIVLVSIIIALLLAGVIAFVLRFLTPKSHNQVLPYQKFAQAAQSATEALQAGGSFPDVVIQCYYQMGQTLEDLRGIERERSMTTREFENILQEQGFPKDPVHRLTQLFEKVRYGSQAANEVEKRQAVESLNAIVAFCDRRSGGG